MCTHAPAHVYTWVGATAVIAATTVSTACMPSWRWFAMLHQSR